MDEVVRTVAWSAPISALFVTVAIWLGKNTILERLKGAIKFEYDQLLETHKAELKSRFDKELEVERSALKASADEVLEGRKAELKAQADTELERLRTAFQTRSHLSKARFDMEFSGYQKLWSSLAAVVDSNARLTRLYGTTERSPDKKEKFGHAENADRAYFSAATVCLELEPFVRKEIFQSAQTLISECKKEIDGFFQCVRLERDRDSSYDQAEAAKEALETHQRIMGWYGNLADAIRERLGELTESPPGLNNA